MRERGSGPGAGTANDVGEDDTDGAEGGEEEEEETEGADGGEEEDEENEEPTAQVAATEACGERRQELDGEGSGKKVVLEGDGCGPDNTIIVAAVVPAVPVLSEVSKGGVAASDDSTRVRLVVKRGEIFHGWVGKLYRGHVQEVSSAIFLWGMHKVKNKVLGMVVFCGPTHHERDDRDEATVDFRSLCRNVLPQVVGLLS